MSFDLLAPHYRWMERWCAGSLLQQCRMAHVASLPAPGQVLIYGEGNGRFLAALCRQFPAAEITVVDASTRMLQLAKERLVQEKCTAARVQFIHADALEWQPPAEAFDLLVTHFFLDCFRADQLQFLVPRIAGSAKPQANWLLADFRVAETGFSRQRSRIILALLYAFFRQAAGIPAQQLTTPDTLLQSAGFTLQNRLTLDLGLLHSDWWTRGPALCA